MPATLTERENEWNVLVCDENSRPAVPRSPAFRVLHRVRPETAETVRNLFVLCSAFHLPHVADFVTAVNRRHHLLALFVRQDVDPAWLPQMLERADLRTLRNMIVHSDNALPKRVMTAWRHGAQDQLIANATVVGDRLFVSSCMPETFEVGFDQMAALRRINKAERKNLEIADDGSYIHWPESDVHLDLDSIRSVLDPAWGAKCQAARLAYDKAYGAAIATLREERGLRQRDISGLSERQVRRIEAGEGLTASALAYLAEAHGMKLDEYLQALAERAHSRATA